MLDEMLDVEIPRVQARKEMFCELGAPSLNGKFDVGVSFLRLGAAGIKIPFRSSKSPDRKQFHHILGVSWCVTGLTSGFEADNIQALEKAIA